MQSLLLQQLPHGALLRVWRHGNEDVFVTDMSMCAASNGNTKWTDAALVATTVALETGDEFAESVSVVHHTSTDRDDNAHG